MENPNHPNSHMQDVICELGNIGIGSASTALSYIVQQPITTATSQLTPIHQAYVVQQQINEDVIGILYPFDKDVQGFALFLLEQEFVQTLLKKLTDHSCCLSDMGQGDRDMLQEVSSIMISTYLSALAEAASIQLRIHLPAITVDMRGSIINDALSLILSLNQDSYWLDHEFHIKGSKVQNHIFFIVSSEGIHKILHALEVKK